MWCGISFVSGWISVKLSTNIYHAIGKNWKDFQGQQSVVTVCLYKRVNYVWCNGRGVQFDGVASRSACFCFCVYLLLVVHLFIYYCRYYFYYHIATGMKIRLSKNKTTTGYHTASNETRKATSFSLWRAIDKHWNIVSLVSSVTAVTRLPRSWISFMADWFQVPTVSTATGKKMWEAESTPYAKIEV